tara:strand:- start:1288 stop:2196 length:909 start_codon:yes stop_codon:yes gene_type:complete
MSKGKTTTTNSIPEYVQQQQQEVFQAARGVAGQPFVPYTGPRVAGFTPDQLRQFEATRGLFETGMEYDPVTGIRDIAQAPTPSLLGADIGAYQSPFQEQVIETTLGDIQRRADIARQQAQDVALGAGAFGGSRSAILEAESQRPFIEQMARTSAGLRQAGFEQAQRAAESDIAREMAGRQFQAGLLGSLGAEQRARLGALGAIGEQQRMLQQQALQVPYQEFQRALAYGPQQLGLLQSGLPGQVPVSTASKRSTGLGDVIGTGLQLYGLFGNPFSGLFSGGASAAGSGMGGGITRFLPGGSY